MVWNGPSSDSFLKPFRNVLLDNIVIWIYYPDNIEAEDVSEWHLTMVFSANFCNKIIPFEKPFKLQYKNYAFLCHFLMYFLSKMSSWPPKKLGPYNLYTKTTGGTFIWDILLVREIVIPMKTLFWGSFWLAEKKSQCLIGSKKSLPASKMSQMKVPP